MKRDTLKAGDRFLLNHPFYRDWVNGKLCREDLAVYASEYEHFIKGLLPIAWKSLGYDDVYEEEIDHAKLWEEFGKAVGYTPTERPLTESMKRLEHEFRSVEGDRPSIVGFLYAFEHQQPDVSTSKLEGLKRWFNVPESGMEYFSIHAASSYETDILRKEISTFNEEEFNRCKESFDRTVNFLWELLSDIQKLRDSVRPSS